VGRLIGLFQLGLDVNRSDADGYLSPILYLFSHFLSDSDSNMDRLKYKCEYGLLLLQIRIDMCQIRSEPDADNVEYGCFFRYRVKATFIHITYVVNSNTI